MFSKKALLGGFAAAVLFTPAFAEDQNTTQQLAQVNMGVGADGKAGVNAGKSGVDVNANTGASVRTPAGSAGTDTNASGSADTGAKDA